MFTYPNKPKRIYNVAAIQQTLNAKWIVQPKWNGHRALPFCDVDGKVTVYSRFNAPLTLAASQWSWLAELDLPRPWALDGELLRNGSMIVWDFSVMAGETRTREPYINRLQELTRLMPHKVRHDLLSIDLIQTLAASDYGKLEARKGEPELEGFVFKHTFSTEMWGHGSTRDVASQFKFRF